MASRISGLNKISGLETNIFELKMKSKSGLEFFCFQIMLAPSELPAKLPGQFSLPGQLFLHWLEAILKGLKSSRSKKDLNDVTAAPFLVSFSQLPAAKKHRKLGSCDIIRVLLIS